jgi:hypothetical protein
MTNKPRLNTGNLTRSQKLDICIAYLCTGNSARDLAIQLIETLGGTDIDSGAVETYYDDITADMVEKVKNKEMEATEVQETLEYLLEVAESNQYEYDTTIWG